MTATRQLAWAARPAGRRSVLLTSGVLGVVALTAGVAVGRWFLLAIGGLAATVVVAVMLRRVDLAVAVLAADFFFNSYLVRGQGLLTVDKGIGAIAVLAWGLDWAVNRRPVLATRQLWLLGAFLVWIGVSFTAVVSYRGALVTSLRYVTFATLYFLVVQTVRGDRRRADLLVQVITIAAAAAGLIGLIAFFSHHVARASGPIKDPNDFAFLLASSLPLAIYQLRWEAARWRKAVWALCLALIAACTLATFSRSALTGLAVATAWAIGTGRLRLRWLAVIAAAAAAIVGAAFWFTPQLVRNDFHQKAYVALTNVDVRVKYYRVEVSEWRHYPVTGVGPGNFVYRFYEFAPGAGVSLTFPSNVLSISGEEAYLVILAEQGAPGLLLFLGYLALSWADLRRRHPGDPRMDQLQGAIAAGFIIACVGALFLAEQYYPPLWFLPALGASMAAAGGRGPVSDARMAGPARWPGPAAIRAGTRG